MQVRNGDRLTRYQQRICSEANTLECFEDARCRDVVDNVYMPVHKFFLFRTVGKLLRMIAKECVRSTKGSWAHFAEEGTLSTHT